MKSVSKVRSECPERHGRAEQRDGSPVGSAQLPGARSALLVSRRRGPHYVQPDIQNVQGSSYGRRNGKAAEKLHVVIFLGKWLLRQHVHLTRPVQ